MKKNNLFEGVDKTRLEKALSILYSTREVDVKVTLKEKKAQAAPCTKKIRSMSLKNSYKL